MFEIRRVTTHDELLAIGRLRYSVYVEEMKWPQKHADHTAKTIVDPLDYKTKSLYAAWENGEAIGTIRNNNVSDVIRTGDYDMYDLCKVPMRLWAITSVTTRYMVHKRYRKGVAAIRLAQHGYREAIMNGIAFDYIDCSNDLVGFYQRFGYVKCKEGVLHPEYGEINIMRLKMLDLTSIGYSLRSTLSSWQNKNVSEASSVGQPDRFVRVGN